MGNSLNELVVVSVNDQAVSLGALLKNLQLNGVYEAAVSKLVENQLVLQAAKSRGLEVAVEELQGAVDRFRQALGLHKAEDTFQWLKKTGLTVEDLEDEMSLPLLRNTLKSQVVSADQVKKYFEENKLHFDEVDLSHLVVKEEGMANELLTQIQDEDTEFTSLAQEYSIDQTTSATGGQVGRVRRGMGEPSAEALIFGAKADDVVGPVKVKAGYALYKINAFHKAELTESLAHEVQELLFGHWFEKWRAEAHVESKPFPC